MNIRDLIKDIDFFKNLSSEQLEIIADISIVTRYSKSSILYYESEVKKSLLFLIDGEIKIYKIDKYGNEIFLYNINKNSMISEISSLYSEEIYCFSNAEFTNDSLVLSINFQKFQEHFISKNILLNELTDILLKKILQLQTIVNKELVFDATSKVAFFLKDDLDTFNKLRRQEVSAILNIQPETLSRVLQKLSRNKTISILKNNQIVIENTIDLEKIIN